MSYLVDADFKSYREISDDCSSHVPYWRVLHSIIHELCKYTFLNPFRSKILCEYCMSSLVGADSKSYPEMSYDGSPFIIFEPCLYTFPNSYRRKAFYEYSVSYFFEIDYKSYSKMSCDYPSKVSYWKNLPALIHKLVEYALKLSHRRKLKMPYDVTKHIIYKTNYCLHCSYNTTRYHMLSLYTVPDSKYCARIPCDPIYLKPYWRKVISLNTHLYNKMMYFLECLNIFKILMNLGNQVIHIKLTTHFCDIYRYG